MKYQKALLIAALLFPIAALTLLVYQQQQKLLAGVEITLPITGFDPRDLLSGHYLQYRLDLNNPTICHQAPNLNPAYVCLYQDQNIWRGIIYYSHKSITQSSCKLYLTGRCENSQFLAGIEKFYVPETAALSLEQQLRNKKGKIVLLVNNEGKATIKNLLIDGQPWKSYLQTQQK